MGKEHGLVKEKQMHLTDTLETKEIQMVTDGEQIRACYKILLPNV